MVPGTNDKIDVNYTVEEQATGSLSASLGYTQGSGVNLGASISEKNFWGTGRSVTLGVNVNDTVKSARFSYRNPYFTIDGVSRGFSLFYRETDFEDDDITSYASDQLGGAVTFGFPVDQYSKLDFSFGYSQTTIHLPTYPVLEVADFIEENGNIYNSFEVSAGWSRNTLNRGIFPTRGMRHRFSGKLILPEISDYNFFKLDYRNDQYYPITASHEWAVHLRGEIGYGDGYGDDGGLPFFENYYSGGIGSIRGFDSNTLGPKSTPDPDPDNLDTDNDPIGGNLLLETSLELIFPFALLEDRSQVRSLIFVDAGNVFNTSADVDPELEADEIRVSVGTGLTWLTVIGPLSFSFGKVLNSKSGDDKQFFQFLLGQTF